MEEAAGSLVHVPVTTAAVRPTLPLHYYVGPPRGLFHRSATTPTARHSTTHKSPKHPETRQPHQQEP